MWPTIPAGRSVLVDLRAYRSAPPRPGDIVLLAHPKQADLVVVKRITQVDEDTATVHGDNTHDSSDSRAWGPVPLDHILGRVECLFGSANPGRSQYLFTDRAAGE